MSYIDYLEYLKIVVGPVSSALLAVYIVNKSKTREDHIERRIDEICNDVRSICDFSCDYWSQDQSHKLIPVEVKIQTRIMYLSRISVKASELSPELQNYHVKKLMQHFARTVTGGDFGVHNRTSDTNRIRDIFHSANNLAVEIRSVSIRKHKSYFFKEKKSM